MLSSNARRIYIVYYINNDQIMNALLLKERSKIYNAKLGLIQDK